MSLIEQLIAYVGEGSLPRAVDLERLRRWFPPGASDEPEADDAELPVLSCARARGLIEAMADREPILLVAPPGVGKTEIVFAAARARGLACRSVLGTQLAPEDLSGVPRIEHGRTVFYPPRVILPEDDRPFCLFLDELPAAAPDVQKAMYSLLLERRIGE